MQAIYQYLSTNTGTTNNIALSLAYGMPTGSADGWPKNQLGERRLGELFC